MAWKRIIFFIFLFSVSSEAAELNFKKIADFRSPWGSTFVSNNEILLTEVSGNLKLINIESGSITEVKHNLKVLEDGQGGLLDILYKDGVVWVSYSEDHGKSKTTTSVARGNFNKDQIDFKNIFVATPPINSGYHFGSRLAIKDNYLFASVGERGEGMIAQDPTKHPGSIIRINTDGSIPKDNPKFIDKKDWLPEIFQIGVRNPQGLTLNPFDQKIYASNHGARGGDWFGEIKKGENYGWKVLGWGGTNYSGTYKGEEFKEWNGHALITSLKDMSLRKLDFSNLENVKEEVIFKREIGRIRDIQVHPVSGKIFFLSQDALWLMQKN